MSIMKCAMHLIPLRLMAGSSTQLLSPVSSYCSSPAPTSSWPQAGTWSPVSSLAHSCAIFLCYLVGENSKGQLTWSWTLAMKRVQLHTHNFLLVCPLLVFFLWPAGQESNQPTSFPHQQLSWQSAIMEPLWLTTLLVGWGKIAKLHRKQSEVL